MEKSLQVSILAYSSSSSNGVITTDELTWSPAKDRGETPRLFASKIYSCTRAHADCWTRRLVLLFFLALTDISLRAIFCRRFVKGARK